MGMLFARRRREQVESITTTENLLQKEHKKAESVKSQVAKGVPVEQKIVTERTVTQPKFKV